MIGEERKFGKFSGSMRERLRTRDPRSIRDLLKGGIVLQETQGSGGRVVADARM
jgi:hypothetical protein